jgi:hypothetical protein
VGYELRFGKDVQFGIFIRIDHIYGIYTNLSVLAGHQRYRPPCKTRLVASDIKQETSERTQDVLRYEQLELKQRN